MSLSWLILGILLGALAIFGWNNRWVKLTLLDWVLVGIAVVFFVLAIANYSGSMQELEPRAAAFLLASFGIPGLILVAIAGVRVWRKNEQQKPAAPTVKS